MSVKEKLSVLKKETEKSVSSREKKDDRTKPRISQSSSRVKSETPSKSTKPAPVSGRNLPASDSTPRRSQLSYRTSNGKFNLIGNRNSSSGPGTILVCQYFNCSRDGEAEP